ncbi:hypothetical protein VPH1254_0049 [Vibrio phage 1254]|nr:hypothetical protein SIPHO017v1_p0019 [Vibrio phage 19E33.1]QZI92837.1 hypothetical protein SIPHO016v1_p0058 [Vibrio phage 38E33.6a]QZI92963.1 hypothetical protein SIPHO015v1_p0025 [Vibrio phage 82E32.2]QZI93018.1 hypothetical protein SIPHO014v1_p0019 [Vibrio phage 82E32.3]QZI93065.1 hypothetical protein SIPHO013v1_p0004 [Vibrio phage 82E33.2]
MDVYFPVRMGLVDFDRTPNERMQLKSFSISPSSKFQLGGLCKQGHSARDADGNNLGMTIRYKVGGNCVECARLTSKRAQHASRDAVGEKELNCARACSRLEDMQIAKEMGLTLEEYYSE